MTANDQHLALKIGLRLTFARLLSDFLNYLLVG
jgi:hypothetical protein